MGAARMRVELPAEAIAAMAAQVKGNAERGVETRTEIFAWWEDGGMAYEAEGVAWTGIYGRLAPVTYDAPEHYYVDAYDVAVHGLEVTAWDEDGNELAAEASNVEALETALSRINFDY